MAAAVDGETKMEPDPRHWCVIGAGASGLVVMKELNEIGIKVIYIKKTTCYDAIKPCNKHSHQYRTDYMH